MKGELVEWIRLIGFVRKAVYLAINCERLIGTQFEIGLQNLRAVAGKRRPGP